MSALKLFLGLSLVVSTFAQNYCPPTEVLFLLDESENAHMAASTDPDFRSFDLLQEAIRTFLSHPLVVNSPNDFRVGAISYSSGTDQRQVIPIFTDRTTAFNYVANIGQVSHAGSWTYRGLEFIRDRPRYANQLLIVVSSQGSGDTSRRALAQEQTNRVMQSLGWRPYVIAAQGVNQIDLDELTIVNNNQPPEVLYDSSIPPQGYRQLGGSFNRLIEQLLCTAVTTTTTTPRPIVQTGICSDCLYEAGYGFDFDPLYCDSYYMCVPGQEPIRKSCPAGTFWSGSICDFIENVNCAVGTCLTTTAPGTRYPSGRCCNKYFECNGGVLYEMDCPAGQVYNTASRSCITTADTTAICENEERYMCDVNLGGGGTGGIADCSMYAPDPFGNPCRFMFAEYVIDAPPGTVWSQASCSLVFANTDACGTALGSVQNFFGIAPAGICNAVFVGTFDNGAVTAYSERQGQNLDAAITLNEVRMEQNGLMFTSNMFNPYGYYYFFNNRAVTDNTAFRVRFRLDDTTGFSRRYDILSNNFCDLCPETVSITVTPTNGNQRQITATFTLTNGQTVSTSAVINMEIPTNELEVIVVVGQTSIYGQVSELQGSNPNGVIQTVDFNPVGKPAGVEVQPNRCGYQLGQGPNDNFVGLIDDFAVFEYCADINQVLRP